MSTKNIKAEIDKNNIQLITILINLGMSCQAAAQVEAWHFYLPNSSISQILYSFWFSFLPPNLTE